MRTAGPVATVYIDRDGAPMASPGKIIAGTLHGVVIGLLIGLGMRWLTRRGWNFTDKLAVAAIFGTSYTAYPRVADIIWSDFPQGYQWMMIFSDGVSWILMAAVMAWFTGPRPHQGSSPPL
jgi:hypothetical protein